MERAGITAFQALGLRDYARVDFRLARDGKVYLLEANPNPYLYSTSEYIKGARASGRTYAQTILEIVELARARYAERPARSQGQSGWLQAGAAVATPGVNYP